MPISLDQISYGNLLKQIKEQNNNVSSSNGSSDASGGNGGITLNSLRQLQQSRQKEKQEDTKDDIDLTGKRQLNAAESALAGLKGAGDSLMEATGFGEKWQHVKDEAAEGHLDIGDIADAVPNFLASVPAGLVAGLTEAPAFLAEFASGNDITQAEQDKNGNWYGSDNELTPVQRLGSGVYGAMDLVGIPFLGGSKTMLKGAGKAVGAWAGREATEEVAERGVAKAVKELGKDAATEGLEEGVQTAFEYMRGDENGSQTEKIFSEEGISSMLESAGLGAAGGAVMHGAGKLANKAASLLSTEGKENSTSTASTADKDRDLLSPLSSIRNTVDDGSLLNPAREEINNTVINEEPEDGVASFLVSHGQYDLNIDDGALSTGFLRGIAENNETFDMFYNLLIPENSRLRQTYSDANALRAVFREYNEDTVAKKFNDIIKERKEEGLGYTPLSVSKEPASNEGPLHINLVRVVANRTPAKFFNGAVYKILNMDADGDKGKVSFKQEDLNRSRYASRSMYDYETGKSRVDFDYLGLDRSKEGMEAALAWSYNYLRRAPEQLFGKTEANINSPRPVKAFTEDDFKRIWTVGTDDEMAELLDYLGNFIELHGGDKFSEKYIGELLNYSKSRRVEIYVENVKKRTEDTTELNISNEPMIDVEKVVESDISKLSFKDFTIKLLSELGLSITPSSIANPLFRSNQASMLELKDKGYKTITPSLYKFFLAHKAQLETLGEKPVNTIETLFNSTVIGQMTDLLAKNGFDFKVGIRSKEHVVLIQECFKEAWNSCVDQYNKAVKDLTLEKDEMLLGVGKKNKLSTDEVYPDMVRVFKNMQCSVLLGESNEDYLFTSFGDMLRIEASRNWDDGSFIEKGEDYDIYTAKNDFIGNLVRNYESEFHSLNKRYKNIVKKIADSGTAFKGRVEWDNKSSFIDFASGIVRMIGTKALRSLNLFELESFMSYGREEGQEFGPYWEALTSGSEKQVENAIATLAVQAQFRNLREAVRRYASLDEVRYEALMSFAGNPAYEMMAIEYYNLYANGESLSDSLIERFCNLDTSLGDKEKLFKDMNAGKTRQLPMLASLLVNMESDVAIQSAIAESNTASLEITRSCMNNKIMLEKDVANIIDTCNREHFSFYDFCRDSWSDEVIMGDSLVASFAYACTTLTNNVMEKSKNYDAASFLYSGLSLFNKGCLCSWQRDIFGHTHGEWELGDILGNRVILGEILFQGKEITAYDKKTGEDYIINAGEIARFVLGREDLAGKTRLKEGDFASLIEAMPQLITMFVPQVIDTNETGNGATVEARQYEKITTSFEKYRERRQGQGNSKYTEENLINQRIFKMMNDSSFYLTIANEIGEDYIYCSPNELRERVNKAARREALASLGEAYKATNTAAGGIPGDFGRMLDEKNEAAYKALRDFHDKTQRIYGALDDFEKELTDTKSNLFSQFFERAEASLYFGTFLASLKNDMSIIDNDTSVLEFAAIYADNSTKTLLDSSSLSISSATEKLLDGMANAMRNELTMFLYTDLFGFRRNREQIDDLADLLSRNWDEFRDALIKVKTKDLTDENAKKAEKDRLKDEYNNTFNDFIYKLRNFSYEQVINDIFCPMVNKLGFVVFPNFRVPVPISYEDTSNVKAQTFIDDLLKTAKGLGQGFYNFDPEEIAKKWEDKKKRKETVDNWNKEIRRLALQNLFDDYEGKPNITAFDQLDEIYDFRVRMAKECTDYLCAEENHGLLQTISNNSELREKLLSTEFAEPLGVFNPYNANLGAKMQLESGTSGISTLVGLNGVDAMDVGPLAAIRPQDLTSRVYDEVDILENWSEHSTTLFDSAMFLSFLNSNRGKWISFRNYDYPSSDMERIFGKTDLRTYDGIPYYRVTDQFISIAQQHIPAQFDQLDVKSILIHDRSTCQAPFACALCGGSPTYSNGELRWSAYNPGQIRTRHIDGSVEVPTESRVVAAVRALGYYAMEARVLKLKKAATPIHEIIPEYDSAPRRRLFSMGKGKSLNDLDNEVKTGFAKYIKQYQRYMRSLAPDAIGKVISEDQMDLMLDLMNRQIKLVFKNGGFITFTLDQKRDVKDQIIKVLVDQFLMTDQTAEQYLTDNLSYVAAHTESVEHLSARLSYVQRQTRSEDHIPSAEELYEVSHAELDAVHSNMEFNANGNPTISQHYAASFRNILGQINAVKSPIPRKVTLEDNPTALQNWMDQFSGKDSIYHHRQEEITIKQISDTKEIKDLEALSKGLTKGLLSASENLFSNEHLISAVDIMTRSGINKDESSTQFRNTVSTLYPSTVFNENALSNFIDRIQKQHYREPFYTVENLHSARLVLIDSNDNAPSANDIFNHIDTLLQKGEDVIINANVYEYIKKSINRSQLKCFKQINGSDFRSISSADYRKKNIIATEQYKVGTRGLSPKDILIHIADNFGMVDSGIKYLFDSIKHFDIPYLKHCKISISSLTKGVVGERKLNGGTLISREEILKMPPNGVSNILNSLDLSFYRNSGYRRETIREATKKFLTNKNNLSGELQTGYNLEHIQQGSCIGVYKIFVNGETKYIPIILNDAIPPNSKIKNVWIDKTTSEITGLVDGMYHFGDKDSFKMNLPGAPYKSICIVENADNEKLLTYIDERGNKKTVNLTEAWPMLAGVAAKYRVDGVMDAFSFDKRMIGNNFRLRNNLHYLSRKVGCNLFFRRDPKDPGKWIINPDINPNITSEKLMNLLHGDSKEWNSVLYASEHLFLDASKQALIKKIYRHAQAHNVSMATLIGSMHFPPGSIIGNSSNDRFVRSSYGKGDNKKIPRIEHSSMNYDFELFWNGFSQNDILLFYNTMDPSFCPPSFSKYWETNSKDQENWVLDCNGDILAVSNEVPGKKERKMTWISPPEFLSPLPGQRIGNEARQGMQYKNDAYLKYGLPQNEDDMIDYLDNLSVRAHSAESMSSIYSVKHREQLDKYYSGRVDGALTDEQMEAEYKAINRLRYLPRYRDFYEALNEIRKGRKHHIKLVEFGEGDQLVNAKPESYAASIADLRAALECKELPDYIALELYQASIGWDYNPGYNTVSVEKFNLWVQRIVSDIRDDGCLSFSWINTKPKDDRYPLALMDRSTINFLAKYSKYSKLSASGDTQTAAEIIVEKLDAIQDIIDDEIKKETSFTKRQHLQMLVDYLRFENGLEDKVNATHVYGTTHWSDIAVYRDDFLRATFNNDRDAIERARKEWEHCDTVAGELANVYKRRHSYVYEDLDMAAANEKKGDKLFDKLLCNMSIISKAMSFLHPLMPVANMLDRATGTTVQTAMFRASMHGFGPYTSLRNAAQYVPSKSFVHRFSENPTVQRIWRAYQQAAFEGDGLQMLSNIRNEKQLEEYLDNIEKNNKNKLEKAFGSVSYFATGGKFFMSNQLENLILAFVSKAYASGQTWWFSQVEGPDGKKVTYLESVLENNPAQFLQMLFDTDGPAFLIGQQAINLVKEGDKAQKNIVSIIYHELASRTTLGKFLFETGFCKFPQYATNKIGNIFSWIAPVSSLHHLAAKAASQYGGQNETMKGIAAEAETIVSQSSLREAILVDVARMTTGFVAMALFGLAAFEPPDDDDKLYNIDEWTIFGFRISDEWWIADTLGLALPLAASWKLQFMGKPNIQLLVNGVAKVCYNNPAIRIADAVSCILNPDITLDDFIDEDKYENALGGAPVGLEWLSESWQSLGWSYLSQFFTPSFLREVYTDFNSYEVSTKRIYEEDATGHLTEDGANGKTMVTDFSDQQLRKLCKNNPIIALAANFFLQPNTSYWAYEMPKTVYYDQNQMDSMNAYSLYNDDGTEKSDEQLDAMFCEIWSIMSSTDDMEELYDAGFYLDYETKAWMSKILYEMSSDLRNEYYERDANGEFDYYLLGDGDWSTGKKLAKEIQSAYWDDINMINDFYQNKLWSEPMRRSMQTYNRINTTYEQDANGDWYATGYRKQSIPFWPIMSADGTLTDAEGTAGYDQDWATLSAVNGQAMYDENGNGLRGLVAYEYDTMSVPDFDSWKDDDDDDSSNKNSSGSSSGSDGSTSTGYPRSSGGGYSSGGSKVKFSSSPSRVTYDRSTTMDSTRPYDADFDYLRPSFTTKGSREAYRREDY